MVGLHAEIPRFSYSVVTTADTDCESRPTADRTQLAIPRVEKTYSENILPTDFSIDTPGLTDVYPFQNLRDELDDP